MRRQVFTSTMSLLLILLIAAAAMLTGCGRPGGHGTALGGAEIVERYGMGSGETTITFTVVDDENKAVVYTLHTDATNLRGVLTECDLIPAGNPGDMVTTVCGLTADWSVDQGWWCLYEGDTMANTGVDGMTLTEGGSYTFVYTRG